MKKGYVVVAGIFLALFLISFVSAATDFPTVMKNIGSSVGTSLNDLINNQPAFIKTLFFFLVFIIVASLVEFIPLFRGKQFMGMLVAFIVSILAVFFLPAEIMKSLLAPYEAMGIAFTTIIPFIFMYLFSTYMLTNRFLKDLVWFFFTVFLIALTIYDAIMYPTQWFKWIYAIVSIMAMAMLYFHTQLDRAMLGGKLEGTLSKAELKLQRKMAYDQLQEMKMKSEGI